MIEKSRLEELIKQGATIYCADRDVQFPILIFLNEEDFVKKEDLSHEESCVRDNIPLEDLYETEKQAEWALKYQHIIRAEELNLPTWEEFKNSDKPIRFCGNDWQVYELGIVLNLNEIYLDLFDDYDTYTQERYKATEENYIKACNVALKLFKGEEE